MAQMKRFAEAVSVQMGYGGEINDFVLEIAESMLTNEDDINDSSHPCFQIGNAYVKKCSVCGGEIPPERLEILPNTHLCVKCSGSHAPEVVHDPETLCAKASPSGQNGWSPSS